MDFIRNDATYSKCYDEFVVLLGTGLRISEFCGLTKAIWILKIERSGFVDNLHGNVTEDTTLITKTENGSRYIPMTNDVCNSLQNILNRRGKLKTEYIIDGYSGFILIDKNNRPKVALHIQNEMRGARKKYNELHPNCPLPNITPHVLRHTFCTNMTNSGMNIKVLQYVMGHSDVDITLNVYTHADYDQAAEQMMKIAKFNESGI